MPNRLERKAQRISMSSGDEERVMHKSRLDRVMKAPLLGVLAAYRYAVAPLLGVNCRHLPSCSDYAREAIEKNGAWKGGWLTLARLCRCHPWGSHGFDPVPDLSGERHALAPWRYGRWRFYRRDAGADSR